MSNVTDPSALSIHGVNPQHLIEKIMRNRIYSSIYWKEQCFGLTTASLVDKAVELEYFGGTFGGNQQPTPFLCLLLKMLQLQPEMEVIEEFIQQDEYKYVTVLGMVYLRLAGKPVDIYRILEPFYSDYRKIRKRNVIGWEIIHIDEIVDALLTEEFYMDLNFPRLTDREYFTKNQLLPPRKYPLEEMLQEDDSEEDDHDNENENENDDADHSDLEEEEKNWKGDSDEAMEQKSNMGYRSRSINSEKEEEEEKSMQP